MSSRVSIKGKLLGETRFETFDFISQLAAAETISSASVTATVYSGVDASPSGIISGSAAISGTQVKQLLTGGVLGVTYNILCAAVTNTGETLDIGGYLTIVPDTQ